MLSAIIEFTFWLLLFGIIGIIKDDKWNHQVDFIKKWKNDGLMWLGGIFAVVWLVEDSFTELSGKGTIFLVFSILVAVIPSVKAWKYTDTAKPKELIKLCFFSFCVGIGKYLSLVLNIVTLGLFRGLVGTAPGKSVSPIIKILPNEGISRENMKKYKPSDDKKPSQSAEEQQLEEARKKEKEEKIKHFNELGLVALQKGDKEVSYKAYYEAAELGDLDSLTLCGTMLFTGDGIPKDEDKGAELLHSAAKRGHDGAWEAVESYYAEKIAEANEREDYQTVFKYAEKSADIMSVRGLYMCGKMLFYGIGTEANEKRGMELLEQVARNGHPEAMEMVGTFHYQTGNQYRKKAYTFFNSDKKQFQFLFMKAMREYTEAMDEYKHADSAFALGEIYLEMEEYKDACDCFIFAAEKGHKEALSYIRGFAADDIDLLCEICRLSTKQAERASMKMNTICSHWLSQQS